MDQIALVEKLVEPALGALGYHLVRVRLSGGEDRCLQIMAERIDYVAMTVEDCAILSRNISSLLDAEDPINEAYTLEVSSPGIDRPLVRLADYDRFAGFDARLESKVAVLDRMKFNGILKGIDGDDILIDVDGEIYEIPFASIHRAKLLLTDELIAASQNSHKSQNALR
ncbi:MAG: Ribosome maturation factor RimP [Alphaproteobacteria bacterium MarineAlpha11_Bin1]|nr:MAG: Ribosome maturation factor RimP [Alphaproteobacteria bacterium MarineAlpha11_Bin1]|tara:strand:- start:4018 stop:4524 length:507 start_codon:yes stop_codon:yes gene_type:complete